jgi:iron complex outermembrane receptor protein
VDASVRRRAGRVTGEVSTYLHSIDNLVFLDFTGEEENGLREAEFLQGDSRFVGAEASVNVAVHRAVSLSGTLSAVRATLTTTGEPLPRIPPIGGRLEANLSWRDLRISPEVVLNGSQDRVFRHELPTDGSAVVNLGVSYFVVRGHATHAISLKAYNLTNETYRQHTSLIKDLAPEIGRGVRLSYSVKLF